jgi:hypothetical protein
MFVVLLAGGIRSASAAITISSIETWAGGSLVGHLGQQERFGTDAA